MNLLLFPYCPRIKYCIVYFLWMLYILLIDLASFTRRKLETCYHSESAASRSSQNLDSSWSNQFSTMNVKKNLRIFDCTRLATDRGSLDRFTQYCVLPGLELSGIGGVTLRSGASQIQDFLGNSWEFFPKSFPISRQNNETPATHGTVCQNTLSNLLSYILYCSIEETTFPRDFSAQTPQCWEFEVS